MGKLKLIGFLIVVLIACHLRVGAIANTEIENPIRADANDYYSYAYNLITHNTYSRQNNESGKIKPDAIRPPVYPIFISALIEYPPTDTMLLKINLYQSILGVLTIIFAMLIYNYMMSYWYSLIAAFFTAMSPHLVSFTTYLLTETLFTFLLVLSIWLAILTYTRSKTIFYFIIGVLLALCALTRPTLNYFLLVYVLFFFTQYAKKISIKYTVFLLLGFGLCFSPWLIRNYISVETDLQQSLSIKTIHHGMYPNFMYKNIQASRGFPYRFDPDSTRISKNYLSLIEELKRRFRENTLEHMKWYLLEKPLTFFSWSVLNGWGDVFIYPVVKSPYFDDQFFKLTRLIMYWLHWPLIILSLFACIIVWLPNTSVFIDAKKIFAGRMISLLIIYFILLHMVGAPFPRYSVPLRPFNYGMAMFFISFVVIRTKN